MACLQKPTKTAFSPRLIFADLLCAEMGVRYFAITKRHFARVSRFVNRLRLAIYTLRLRFKRCPVVFDQGFPTSNLETRNSKRRPNKPNRSARRCLKRERITA